MSVLCGISCIVPFSSLLTVTLLLDCVCFLALAAPRAAGAGGAYQGEPHIGDTVGHTPQ
jgi:hypothetical protein